MLAKAYSIVRGSREKEDLPPDEFFKTCAPLIGVVPPEEHQQSVLTCLEALGKRGHCSNANTEFSY